MKTNRGKYRILEGYYRNEGPPASFFVALVTGAVVPDADTETFDELTEIAAGNGYESGGFELLPNNVDWDALVEDSENDLAYIQAKDVVWTASGGSIPSSGDGARYAVLLDDNEILAGREVLDVWDLGTDRLVTDGQQLVLEDLTIRALEAI